MNYIPKVSIIVPIYNVEKFLPRCVDSLVNQSLREIEIILVDDESPDNCPTMCDEYKKLDKRIKVVHKKNGGLGYARNSGMDVAEGNYIAFVDSDDYVDRDMFQQMYSAAEKNNADFVRVDNYKETIQGEILNINYIPPMRDGVYNRDELREQLLYPQFGMLPYEDGSKYVSCSVWRNIYRREIIEKNNIRFVSERDLISEDIPFNLQFMMLCDRAVVINKKFYHYIVNDKSLTQTYKMDRFDKEIDLYNALISRTKEVGIYEYCKIRLSRHLLARARKCIKAEIYTNVDYKEKRRRVMRIIEQEDMKKILHEYPIRLMKVRYAFVGFCLKHKCIGLLAVISRFL